MSEEEGLQFLLDKYGYVVVGSMRTCEIGEIIHGMNLGPSAIHRPDVITVVTGFATVEEWKAQRDELFGMACCEEFDEERAQRFKQIIRVTAE